MIYDWFTLTEPIASGEYTITAVEVEADIGCFEATMIVHKVRVEFQDEDGNTVKEEHEASEFGITLSDIDAYTMDTITDVLQESYADRGHEGSL